MPELQLYQTELDELKLVKAAFTEGCWMVPDSNYQTPEAISLRTVEQYLASRKNERHFFILNKLFSRLPFQMRKISKDGKIVYYISPSQGGPFLEFMGGGVIQDEKTRIRYIRSGFLAYSSGYWNADITRKEAAPSELVETYKRLGKFIRSTSVRIKPDVSVYWLGDDAIAEVERGTELGLHRGWSPPGGWIMKKSGHEEKRKLLHRPEKEDGSL